MEEGARRCTEVGKGWERKAEEGEASVGRGGEEGVKLRGGGGGKSEVGLWCYVM